MLLYYLKLSFPIKLNPFLISFATYVVPWISAIGVLIIIILTRWLHRKPITIYIFIASSILTYLFFILSIASLYFNMYQNTYSYIIFFWNISPIGVLLSAFTAIGGYIETIKRRLSTKSKIIYALALITSVFHYFFLAIYSIASEV